MKGLAAVAAAEYLDCLLEYVEFPLFRQRKLLIETTDCSFSDALSELGPERRLG